MVDVLPLVARGLSREFKGSPGQGKVRALDGFSLEVTEGSVVGLVGPNGSGKTTALRLILGLLRQTAGESRLFGKDPSDRSVKQRLGFAPETLTLSPHRTGRETLTLLGHLSGLKGGVVEERVGRELDRFELTAASGARVSTYSKGMIRRLTVASAFLMDPDLLVLDEPFDGLDPIGSDIVRDEVRRRAQDGAAVLLSSHALSELEEVATHLSVLSGGRTLIQGTSEDVLCSSGQTELLVDDIDEETLRKMKDVAGEAGAKVISVRKSRERLADLFRRRVGRKDP